MGQTLVRDKDIDRIRGFAMIQVILVHTLYWVGLFDGGCISIVKSFFLFEMPLFFFVTGALNRNRTISAPIKFVFRRMIRVMIPYWVFAALNISVIVAKSIWRNTLTLSYIVKAIVSWIIPCDRQYDSFLYSTWALWFIPIYIICVALLPLALKIHKGKHEKLTVAVLIAFVVLFQQLGFGFLQKVSFYMIWVFLGLHYDFVRAYLTAKPIWGVLSACCAGLAVLSFCGFSLDMQKNKFPPNIVFLIFSVGAVTVVLKFIFCNTAFVDKLHQNRVFGYLLHEYEMHSLSIFLYQPIVFYALGVLFGIVPPRIGGNDFVMETLYLIFAIPTCAVTGKLFSYFETIKVGKKTRSC